MILTQNRGTSTYPGGGLPFYAFLNHQNRFLDSQKTSDFALQCPLDQLPPFQLFFFNRGTSYSWKLIHLNGVEVAMSNSYLHQTCLTGNKGLLTYRSDIIPPVSSINGKFYIEVSVVVSPFVTVYRYSEILQACERWDIARYQELIKVDTTMTGVFNPQIDLTSGDGFLEFIDDQGNSIETSTSPAPQTLKPSFDYTAVPGTKEVTARVRNGTHPLNTYTFDYGNASWALTGDIDLTESFANFTSVDIGGNTAVTSFVLSAESVLTNIDTSGCTSLAGIDVSICDVSGITTLDCSNCGWTAAEVNKLLVDLDAQMGAGSATLTMDGTNAAPDGSSGGYDGTTAKTSLQGKGHTVTTS